MRSSRPAPQALGHEARRGQEGAGGGPRSRTRSTVSEEDRFRGDAFNGDRGSGCLLFDAVLEGEDAAARRNDAAVSDLGAGSLDPPIPGTK